MYAPAAPKTSLHGHPFRRGGRDACALRHPDDRWAVSLGRSRGREGLASWRMVAPIRARSHPLPPRARSAGRPQPPAVLLENNHLLCEPLRHVEDAGLVVERLERSKLDIVEWLVTASHGF